MALDPAEIPLLFGCGVRPIGFIVAFHRTDDRVDQPSMSDSCLGKVVGSTVFERVHGEKFVAVSCKDQDRRACLPRPQFVPSSRHDG